MKYEINYQFFTYFEHIFIQNLVYARGWGANPVEALFWIALMLCSAYIVVIVCFEGMPFYGVER